MNNEIREKALELGKMSCNTMINKFAAADLPPKGLFHYHQGVFLSGMMNVYSLCGEEKYYEYMKAWVDSIIMPDGSINTFDPTRLDDIQPGILLIYLYNRTGEQKYKKALDTLMDILRTWHKNEIGGLWHKEMHPNEMWLDGIYMAGPIQAEYASRFGEKGFLDVAAKQAEIMWEHMHDEKTGLLYHAWDYTKKIKWCDKKTGLSPEFWGRSIGWYAVALLDIMSFADKESELYKKLFKIENALLHSVIQYQNTDNGMWYQVTDKIKNSDNWCETSCSCLFTASIARAVKIGIAEQELAEYATKGFLGVASAVKKDGANLLIDGVCVGTGVNDYQGYISRPTSTNDLHGVGAFLLMCSAIAQL